MTDPVPSWVHMADVPPPADPEPWYATFRREQREARDRSRLVTAACILAVGVVVFLLVLAGRAS